MSETATQPKPSPGHRRQGRNHGRGAGQKAYASENDMAAIGQAKQNMNPQTPRKLKNQSNDNQANSAKQRSQHNKSARNKNSTTSGHETDQPATQHMTPRRQKSTAKTPNSMAFAGSTFHSSPAPDAIPMPSFLSKPSSSPISKQATQQLSPPTTSRDTNPPHQRTSVPPSTSESPLNFMFEAHRKEKEMKQAGSSRAEALSETPPAHTGFPNAAAARPSPMRHHSSGPIDGDEFGGCHSQPPGPSFATPFGERMRAARPTPDHSGFTNLSPRHYNQYISPQQSHQYPPSGHAAENAPDPAEALKKMLFSGGTKQQATAAPSTTQSNRPTLSELGASSHRPSQPSCSNGIDLHERIRQELRLDGTAPSPNGQRRLFSQ